MDERPGKLLGRAGRRRVTSHTVKVSRRRGGNGQRQKTVSEPEMRLDTRVFDLCRERYSSLTELARAMGISVSQVYRVRQGKRPINERFITGTLRAFPGYKLDDLFRVVPDGRRYDRRQ